jgi:hypothetical protein
MNLNLSFVGSGSARKCLWYRPAAAVEMLRGRTAPRIKEMEGGSSATALAGTVANFWKAPWVGLEVV